MSIPKLNTIQQACVDDIDGPVMCIAGPGTGKTQLLSARIMAMVKGDQTIDPNMILATTFTDAGAVAMRRRLYEFMGADAYKVSVHTFHSLCNDIVQSNLDYFKVRNAEPVSELEVIDILYKIIDELPGGHPLERVKGDSYFEAMRLRSLFSLMKDEGWDPDHVEMSSMEYIASLPSNPEFLYKRANSKKDIKVGDMKQAMVDKEKEKMKQLTAAAHLLPRYNEILKEEGRYDFSDMITWVLRAFETDDRFLQTFQEKYQYLLLDEFQDTNGVQARLVDKLMSFWPRPNIFAVMDEDQCLYEFNGARMRNIIDFKKKYLPNIYVLADNYRSTQHILDAAGSLIGNNNERLVGNFKSLTKDLVARNDWPDTLPPKAIEFSNPFQEDAWVVDRITALHDQGVEYKDIAVLFRKHKQADNIKRELSARDIPINIKRPVNVLDQVLTNQVLTTIEYISTIAETARVVSVRDNLLFKILHYGFMGVDRKLIEVTAKSEAFPDEVRQKMEGIMACIDMYHNESFMDMFEHFINRCGVLKYIMGHDNQQQLIKELHTLFVFVKSEFFKDPLLTGMGFIDRVKRMREENISLPTMNINYQEEGVTLSTCHGAKGLEWKHVFIIGAVRTEWEASRGRSVRYSLPDTLTFSTMENKLESARRLFYVAITRAMEGLVVTYHMKTLSGNDTEPSRFIDEAALPVEHQITNIDPASHISDLISTTKFLPGLETEQLNRALENYKISVSHVNKYFQCPIAFYYENILKVPFAANENLIYGNSIHIALKFLFDSVRDGKMVPLATFIEVFKAEMFRNSGQISKSAYERRLREGQECLTYYYNELLPSENKITVNEYYVSNLELDGVPVTYIYDKIMFNKHAATIVDYKTGKRNYFLSSMKPAVEDDPGGSYWRQMVMGKLVLDQVSWKPWKFEAAELVLFDGGIAEKFPVEITREDEKVVRSQIVTTYNKIMNHEFSEGCGKDTCDWCNFVKTL